MATKEEITVLYKRYLDNEISKEELEHFLSLLHTPEDEITISSLMDGTWHEMFETQKPVLIPIYKRAWYRVAAAAIIVLLAAGAYFIFTTHQKQVAQKTEQHIKNDIAPGGNKAILTLANGKQIILDSAANGTLAQQGNTKIIKLDSGQLSYLGSGSSPLGEAGVRSEVLYNTLTTPRGGQFQLTLPDGSRVWLNAASSIKYPTEFAGNSRSVEITGEAYFEIKHDAKKPFTVTANGVEVHDLGTAFNINAYDDESAIKTTLLEGSVEVKTEKSKVKIKPGEQARIENHGNPLIQKIMVQTVYLDEVIAWKNGLFNFNKADIKQIMRQAARWYDLDVVYEGNISNEKYIGKVARNTNLSEMMKILELNGVKYRIEGRKITITASP